MKDKAREELAKKFYKQIQSNEKVGHGDVLILKWYYFKEFADLILKNTLTLESKIGEDGLIEEPTKRDARDMTRAAFINRKIAYDQSPTIKQMTSIIREQKEEIERLKIRAGEFLPEEIESFHAISNFHKIINPLKDQLKERDETIRELREKNDNQFYTLTQTINDLRNTSNELTQAKAEIEELKSKVVTDNSKVNQNLLKENED